MEKLKINRKMGKTTKTALLIFGIILSVYLSFLFIVAEEGKEIGDITNSLDAKQVTDVLTLNGITGMKIINYSVNTISIDKTDISTSDFNLSTTFDRSGLKFKSTNDGLKQEVFIINNKLTRESFNFTTIVQIDYSEVTWNGTLIKLGVYDKLHPFTFRTNNGSAPNIFFDTKYNKRINYQDVAEQGGYAIGYSDKGISYIEMIIKDKKIDALSVSKIDPTYYNQTNGFRPSTLVPQAGHIRGIATNGSDFWMGDAADDFIYHVNHTGGNMTGGFKGTNYGGGTAGAITTNGSDFWIGDSSDAFIYHTDALGNNQTNGFPISNFGGDNNLGMTTNGSDFWIYDYNDKTVYHTDALGNNMSGAFKTDGFMSGYSFGITTNGSDFWIGDYSNRIIYHTDRNGGSVESFSVVNIGVSQINSLVTNVSLPSVWASPTDFWISDDGDKFIYHLGLNDQFPPTITPAYPLNASTIYSTSLTYDVNFTIVDDGTIDTVWYSNDSGVNNITLASDYGNITQKIWDASNNITIWANDSVNNVGTASLTFFIKNSTDVDNCGYLMIENRTYNMVNNITCPATAITIVRNNETLIGNGYTINYSYSGTLGYGVYNYGYNYSNLSGLTIREGKNIALSVGNVDAIELLKSRNNIIENNTIYMITSGNYYPAGIYLAPSSNNTISSNNIYGKSGTAIYLAYGTPNTMYNLIKDNYISYTGSLSETLGYGIQISTSHNNTFINNTVMSNTTGLWHGAGINNLFINNTFITYRGAAVMLYGAPVYNNTFINTRAESRGVAGYNYGVQLVSGNNRWNSDNSFIDSINISGGLWDVYHGGDISSSRYTLNNTFLNCSYNMTKENQSFGQSLYRKWYYRAYVYDESGNPLENFNITAFQVNGSYAFNLTTDATGYTPIYNIIDYFNFNDTRTFYSNYTIYADNITSIISHTFNASLGNNLSDMFNITLVSDTEYPQFSSYWDNNGTQTKTGTGYFNVTLLSTNGTVILNFNNTNYTASNWSDPAVFNVTISGLTNGTYPYNWSSYGNGTNHLYNVSNSFPYLVNWTDVYPPHFTYIPDNVTINYTQGFGVDFNATDDLFGGTFGYYSINWTTLFTINESGWLTNSSKNLGAGLYWINVTINDTMNNLNSTIYLVNISRATSTTCGLFVNPAPVITYPTVSAYSIINLDPGDADVVYHLYRDGVDVGYPDTVTLGVGVYTYLANCTGGQNWTDKALCGGSTLTVNQGTSQTSLTFDIASPQVYGTAITPTCSIITGGTEALTLTNGTSGVAETLGAGNWTFNCSYAGNANWTESSNFSLFNITKAGNPVTLLLNGLAQNISITDSQQLNATGTVARGVLVLYRNETNVTSENGLNVLLGVGNYTYLVNATGNQNYSDNSTGLSYTADITATPVSDSGGGAHGTGSALIEFECYNKSGDNCVLIGTYLSCPAGSMNYSSCKNLLNKTLYCGDGICSKPNSDGVDETFYNCPTDCLPSNFFKDLGKTISPSNPLIGEIFMFAMVVILVFFLWFYEINSKLNSWKKKRQITRENKKGRWD